MTYDVDTQPSLAEPPPAAPNRVLDRMLDRLLATLVNGPGLHSRPHRSRQRVDLQALSKLRDRPPVELLRNLLDDAGRAKCAAKVKPPKEGQDEKPFRDQETLLLKLRAIAEDARTYEQDTGAHVLSIGFPLLHVAEGPESREVLAPIAFIPISLAITRGVTRAVELRCAGDGIDRIIPNAALLAWVERQTGQKLPADLFTDAEGEDPWRELNALAEFVANATGAELPPVPPREPSDSTRLSSPKSVAGPSAEPETPPGPFNPETELLPAPASGAPEPERPTILSCAVLGLFPQANESLLRDTQALLAGDDRLSGPIEQFVRLALEPTDIVAPKAAPVVEVRDDHAPDRLISDADPFQRRAVRLARHAPALVIHGPPGTGKSQTITNVIGDHLARGQRVLVVSDKRTALDVVANRLRHLGLGELFGVVHDPQRDRRELYKALRQQLEELPQAQTDARAERELERADDELAKVRQAVAQYFAALSKQDGQGRTIQDLIAEWVDLPESDVTGESARHITLDELEANQRAIGSLLFRAASIDYPRNPWRDAAGIPLADLLLRPMAELRDAMARCVNDAQSADVRRDAAIPPFAPELPLDQQANARTACAARLADLLMATDPAVLTVWSTRSPDEVRAAKASLDAASQELELLRHSALDEGLLEQCRRRSAATGGSLLSHLPSMSEAADQGKALREYAQAYREATARLSTVHAATPHAKLQTIARWLQQGPAACERARKRLISTGTLIKAIGAGELDRQLALQVERHPLTIDQVVAWLPILHDYVHAAGRWYAFLTPGHKTPAKPIAEYFGLPLNVQTGEQMRAFLEALRHRLDLKADLENGILPEPLPPLPSDDELLDAYAENLAVAKAVCDPSLPPHPDLDLAPAMVHELIRPQADNATLVLKAWDMDLTPKTADRLATFLIRLSARLKLMEIYWRDLLRRADPIEELLDDNALDHAITHHADAVKFLVTADADPSLAYLHALLRGALANPARGFSLVEGLRKSDPRARAILALERSLDDSKLLAPKWMSHFDANLRGGGEATPTAQALSDRLGDLEAVLRIREGVRALPDTLRGVTALLLADTNDPEEAMAGLRKSVLHGEITHRLDADPALRETDGHALKEHLRRYRELQRQRHQLAVRAIRHQWVAKQKHKLLAGEGSRLGQPGAELRRRLTLRGERATRLRQVIQMGQSFPGGDPLFDLCPVWMASPETVAQVFPRQPIFDVVIFDEASQCRLEEALPVLTRAKRLVVAGDPQQLPPTRFFESGVEDSEDESAETEQELFEQHQSGIEDLLGAALGLAIQECSLDVHYRSRDGELIRFSNDHFYASRLQAIPGRPAVVPPPPPVKLIRVDGLYEKRRNEREADEVVRLVKELLDRPEPPSIGVACFNLPQRDLIVERLDAAAEQDAIFAERLEAARKRQGTGSFEGLFVKNLENVQGDERDHLVISTTYGPDARGKFRRQFGPLGMPGGGRRLNVLVTRARQQIHVITSIPRDAYASLPPTPEGQSPGGAYLLLAYLRYAENLTGQRPVDAAQPDPARVQTWPTRHPSKLVESLARRLSADGIGCDVYWGNEGFCVDLVRHSGGDGAGAAGLLCDAPRFPHADPVEWDAFRCAMLESQGWTLHRLWSPHFFRDPEGVKG